MPHQKCGISLKSLLGENIALAPVEMTALSRSDEVAGLMANSAVLDPDGLKVRLSQWIKASLADHETLAELCYRLALQLDDAQEEEEAIFFYRLTCLLRESPKAINNIAVLYAQRGRPEQAERTLREGLRHFPEDPTIRENLACLSPSE